MVSFMAFIYSIEHVLYHNTKAEDLLLEGKRCEMKCAWEAVSGWKIILIGNFPDHHWDDMSMKSHDIIRVLQISMQCSVIYSNSALWAHHWG